MQSDSAFLSFFTISYQDIATGNFSLHKRKIFRNAQRFALTINPLLAYYFLCHANCNLSLFLMIDSCENAISKIHSYIFKPADAHCPATTRSIATFIFSWASSVKQRVSPDNVTTVGITFAPPLVLISVTESTAGSSIESRLRVMMVL